MRKKRNKIIFYILLTLLALIWMAPVVTVFITALKSQGDFYSGNSLFSLPDQLKWSNFADAWTKGRLGTYMRNGLVICLMKVPLGILVESLAAFAITRLDIKHKTGIFVFFLLGMMLPHQMALIPLNRAFSRYNLINNYLGLFVVYTGFGIGYGILVLRGFMRSIPKDLDEAAYIDGCGKLRLYFNIILPITKPAIATVFIVDFLNTWNEFLLQSILITSDSLRTVPNGLMSFIGEYGTDYGLLNAGVLISIVPVLVVYLTFQRYFVEGMSGAVKQ
ncbi:carbohydrate ABC transporter permease [Enterocloster lavalensis]|uniref:carbohydrate ABC transporter permease n=1 Tax=Enterocloster lavalensis TaxID=460384 RepID=UPI0023F3925A|nr:carbohydrate ABC transporter permease [Enterocloster lavalensis]